MSQRDQSPVDTEFSGDERDDSPFYTVLYTALSGGDAGILVAAIMGEGRQMLAPRLIDIVILIAVILMGNILGGLVGHRLGMGCTALLSRRCILAIVAACLTSNMLPIGYLVMRLTLFASGD